MEQKNSTMARPKIEPQTGLLPETLNLPQAYDYLTKQLEEINFFYQRVSGIHLKLAAMIEGTGDVEKASQIDGFVIVPTYSRIISGVTLTLKL